MTPDPALVSAIQAILSQAEDPDGWDEVLKTYRLACKLSNPMCGPSDPRLPKVLKRAAHWHTRALLLERAIRDSLNPDKQNKPNNRISDGSH